MKKFSKKGVLLFAAAMALCAFVLPAAASAASWGVVGTHHTLTSPDVGFTSANGGGIVSQCTNSSFTTRVGSAQNLEIISGTFGGTCTATGVGIGTCISSATGTRFPWTGTATTTTNVQIDRVFIDVVFLQTPSSSCLAPGAALTITGTLTSGSWTGNGANQHEIIYTNAAGLVSHSAAFGNNQPVAARGTFRDAQQTLTVN